MKPAALALSTLLFRSTYTKVLSLTHCKGNPDWDVIIAGVGWAGIGAMYEFQLFNDKKPSKWGQNCISYKGFEAGDYFGGRSKAARLISGGEGNPIGAIMWEIFKNQFYHTQVNWVDIAYAFESASGYTSSEVNMARNEWGAAYECIQTTAYQRDADGNLLNEELDIKEIMIDKCGWNYDDLTPLQRAFEWYDLEWEWTLEPNRLSARRNLPLWTYMLFQDRDWMVRGVLADLAAHAVEYYIPSGAALLNSEIDGIKFGDKVEFSFLDPSSPVVQAKKALITFSAGILADKLENGFFDPQTDDLEAKLDAMKSLFYLDSTSGKNVMGLYNNIYVQFNSATWEAITQNRGSAILFVVPEDVNEVGQGSHWQNYDEGNADFFPGSRTMSTTVITKDFEQYSSDVSPILRRLFKALGLSESLTCDEVDFIDLTEEPQNTSACQYSWLNSNNDLWNGAWSIALPGLTEATWNSFFKDNFDEDVPFNASPNDKRLYFTGEAHCSAFSGFTHGAFNAGRLKAREMIYDLRSGVVRSEWEKISNRYLFAPYCDAPDYLPYGPKKSKSSP